ncbi:hypothetical protein DPMN_120804 [Dreissena polymorpha]|uniref:Uncharacterized protein n=1 Tax=Dreissena polymorpha TaxID=45954 RepID=A0A9D4GP96_DREPO|nr:hypothetical protein DPMN_120804 [Dreissena polymorpha]
MGTHIRESYSLCALFYHGYPHSGIIQLVRIVLPWVPTFGNHTACAHCSTMGTHIRESYSLCALFYHGYPDSGIMQLVRIVLPWVPSFGNHTACAHCSTGNYKITRLACSSCKNRH